MIPSWHRLPCSVAVCAPRGNRTPNPLAGSRVISSALPSAAALVSGGAPGLRSSLMLGQSASDSNVSVDQSGRSITRTNGDRRRRPRRCAPCGPRGRASTCSAPRHCVSGRLRPRVGHSDPHPAVLGRTRQAGQVLLACRGRVTPSSAVSLGHGGDPGLGSYPYLISS